MTAAAAKAAGAAWRLVSWPFATLRRVITLGWLFGIGVVGTASLAAADDGMIVGPDIAGSTPTVFESAPMGGYGLPTFIPDSYSWVDQAFWNVINLLATLLEIVVAILLRGALVLMEWMLNITLYRDSASQIDSATQGVASAVFWPLIGCTVASAGFTLYVKAKRDGGGSILGEFMKVAVLTVLAITLVTAPSHVLGPLDDARTAASSALMTGYTNNPVTEGGAVAGFVPVTVTGPNVGARKLADSMWSSFYVRPWCQAMFGGEDLCKQWGQDLIKSTDRWNNEAVPALTDKARGTEAGPCKDKFGASCDVVRGVTINRLSAALVGAFIALPMAILLLLLTVFGLIAVVAVLLLALVAPVFVLGWMIPGIPRTIGLKWMQALVGSLIQSALIVALLGGVMVLSGVLQALVPQYGLLAVGVLNIAVVITALKVRAMFEGMIGMTTPGSSLASSYVAMKSLGALGRAGKRVGHMGAGAVGMGARGISTAAGVGAGGFMNAGGKGIPATTAASRGGRLRQYFAVPTPPPAAAATGGVATPYRRPVVQPTALPAGSFAQTPQRNGSHNAGQGARALPDHSRTVDALPSAQRTAIPQVAASNLPGQTDGPRYQHTPRGETAGRPGRHREPADQPRIYAGDNNTPGVTPPSAARPRAHPLRRDIQSPPLTPPPGPVMHYGAANPLAITRRATPLQSYRPAPKPGPTPRRPVTPIVGYGQATRRPNPTPLPAGGLHAGRLPMKPKDGTPQGHRVDTHA